MLHFNVTLPDSLRHDLAIHAAACEISVPDLLARLATHLTDAGPPQGWEDPAPDVLNQALAALDQDSTLAPRVNVYPEIYHQPHFKFEDIALALDGNLVRRSHFTALMVEKLKLCPTVVGSMIDAAILKGTIVEEMDDKRLYLAMP